MRVACKIKE